MQTTHVRTSKTIRQAPRRRSTRAGLAVVAVAVLLGACGGDTDAEATGTGEEAAEESTTESPPPGDEPADDEPTGDEPADQTTGSETTVGDTGAATGLRDVCATVEPSLVGVVLGPGFTTAPVTVENEADACVWTSAAGTEVLAAATIFTEPGEGDPEDYLTLFGLDPDAYERTSQLSGTGGVAADGDPGPNVVVVAGFTELSEPSEAIEAQDAAIGDISNLLDNIDADG